ncbi:MAG: hypothetical protein Q7R32_13215 [Dehalococcoidia bacterium]|nr:hypothetical protein [Dehalococcoidia bacterium]
MLGRKRHKNHCYFLCLLDWRNFMLSKAEIDAVAKTIGLPVDPLEPPTGWHVGPCPDIAHDAVRNTTIGMAHSRIVFDFEFKDDSALNNFWQIRSIRKELEDQVIAFLEAKAITAMQPILQKRVRDNPERGGPRIFVYPVLEISSGKGFWKDLSEKKPFNIHTTCFHAHLRDFGGLRGRIAILGKIWGTTVKMRVSGAKIIASEMSNTVFILNPENQ